MPPYVRKVKTASGATAVQIVEKRRGLRRILAHVGSAHTEADLAVLVASARERIADGQQQLDLGLSTDPAKRVPTVADADAVVAGSVCEVLWAVLVDAYTGLGFDAVGDEVFRALVLARIIEPPSKLAAVGVLTEIGVPAPHRNTFAAALRRCIARDYRATLATACTRYWARRGAAAFVLYDVTTLYFETENEDELRKVGMSKERRVDPQIQVGLLVDPGGFPLEVHCFEGNKAETKTLLPTLRSFQDRHGLVDMVVVADAGMLSAANLNAIEDAGFSFIVGSRISKAPYDLAAHFERHGNYIPPAGEGGKDGHILESKRVMGTGRAARERRVVYQWSHKRQKRDDRAINAMVDRAEKVADGSRPLKKDRFVKIDGAERGVDWNLVERARQLAGLKGYVTNLPATTLTGPAVIAAYHDLWQVESSFRMAKTDLRARPIFHRQHDSIQAHLTVVFAALAVSRHLQNQTGLSIKKLVRTLRPLRTVQIDIGGQRLTAKPTISPDARAILDALPPINAPGH